MKSKWYQHIIAISDMKGVRLFELEGLVYSLGRSLSSGVVLYSETGGISRCHATLIKVPHKRWGYSKGFTYRILDGDIAGKRSTNGIAINRVYCYAHELAHGDTIFFTEDVEVRYLIRKVWINSGSSSKSAPRATQPTSASRRLPLHSAREPQRSLVDDVDPNPTKPLCSKCLKPLSALSFPGKTRKIH